MLSSIRTKLTLSYLAIALLTAVLIYVLIRVTSDGRLRSLVLEQQIAEIQEEVATFYEAQGSWDGFSEYFRTLHPPPRRPQNGASNHPPPRPKGMHGVADVNGRLFVGTELYAGGEIVPTDVLAEAIPVIVANETVAYIVPDDESGISLAAEEQIYLQRTNEVLIVAGGAAVAAALLMGLGLARMFIQPINHLTSASKAMAAGDLEQRVPITANDELGELATSFNKMSADLAAATRQRRQLTADIAHDLSTPLQVISGYIEAGQDGSLPLTPKRLEKIATEIDHLSRLVEDLDLLAQTDTHTLRLQLEPINPASFLEHVVESFSPLANAESVNIRSQVSPKLPTIQADYNRLMQVMGNLVTNALRYTPVGGDIVISAESHQNEVLLRVTDTGAGISAADLPFIFDRFYRADTSRTEGGKMGLGLAISKALVEAMGGQISARSATAKGTTFQILLPT